LRSIERPGLSGYRPRRSGPGEGAECNVRDRGDERGEGGPGGLDRRGARAYQGALEAVFAIPIAGGLGYWADVRFGTGPIFLIVGLVLGFATFVVRLVRMRSLVEDTSERERKER
jgi:F0F1-type ATP synthase assembly protein I